MAKQTINIGTSANDGTGDPLRTAMDKTNDNFTELYNGAGGVADGAVTTAKLADDAVDSAKITDGAIDTVHIADDQITYAKMGAEFTTAAALSGTDVDWATAQTFTKTLGSNTTLTFSNVSTGMQINLVISGNYTLTLPSSVKELTNASTYDGSGENLISIVSTNGNTEQFATINKVA
jgi:hypothetical protein